MPASEIRLQDVSIRPSVLVFAAGPYRCGIRCENIQEILPIAANVRLPGQPAILDGFLNLRGALVPVIILRALVGLPSVPFDMYTPVLIMRIRGQMLGLCVDRVIEVQEIEPGALRPLPDNHSFNNFAEAEYPGDEGSFVLIRADQLLLAEERGRLEELAELGRRRLAEIEASRR